MFINKITPKNYVISLGGGCDIKLFLINKYFPNQKTEFFDYLWNFDKGLHYVSKILEESFNGFSSIGDYQYIIPKKFDSSLTKTIPKNKISLQDQTKDVYYFVPKKYPEIIFLHYNNPKKFIVSFKKKIKRIKKLLVNNKITFVYYRQFDEPINSIYINNLDYDIDNKIKFWINETEDFYNRFLINNKKDRLISLFALPHDYIKSNLELPKNKTNLFFDYIFYKGLPNNDHTKVNSEMNRIYSKYF